MAYTNDQLIFRNGETVSGKVLKNEFKIRTSFADIIVKKENIAQVQFMRADGSGFPATDEIRTYAGDSIRGKLVLTQTISFVSGDDNQTERVQRDRIHSLIFIDSLDVDTEEDTNVG